MTTQQTVWPCFPLWLPYELNVPRPSNLLRCVVVPCPYNTVTEGPSPKENRKFFLERSVFDLVDGHRYLSLTDPKLLCWYLSLSAEDRKIIQDEGGFQQFLQRHPALELSHYHVYKKYNIVRTSPVLQPVVTSNNHKKSGAKKNGCGMPHTHLESEMFPNNVRETLTPCGHTRQLVYLQDNFQTFNSPIIQEPNHHKTQLLSLNEDRPSWPVDSGSAAVDVDPAALTNFSVDVELERQWGQPELRSANFIYTEVSPLQSTIEKEFPSEHYSQMDGTLFSDGSIVQSAELQQVSSALEPVEENGTEEWCEDDEASLSFEDLSNSICSVMEDDKSILACLASDVKPHNKVHVDPVSGDSEAVAANSETLKSDQSVIKKSTAEKHTFPEPTLCRSGFTQTEIPGTSDKHVITEVHMADLDYLAEEFSKLQMELREQKEKTKSSGCKLRKECECMQRAQRAELCLLALQYSMCRQHCWRLYCTSAEGAQPTPLTKEPPANIVSVLQKLESDYNQMKDQILAGVPLEKLKPLSVDSEKITTGASYTPAQIIGDVLGNVPCWSSQEPQKHDKSGEENGRPNNQSKNGGQQSQKKEKLTKKENSKAGRAVSVSPKDKDALHNTHKQENKQTEAACKELNTSEAWYDAEEDLQPVRPDEMGQDLTVILKDKNNESSSEETRSSGLCVTNLPSNVTESDVMLWFEKYQPSEVSISALQKDFRVAIVMTSGPQYAEAAVREMNGRCKRGRTLHVEHISRAVGASQTQTSSASIAPPEPSQEATKPQSFKSDSSSTERKLITQPPLSSSIKTRKVVCISPTAKGTCVPQHFGTMGSFDILMAELTQRHPDVGRQRIVDALIELKTKHQGVLSGLPLSTIREMTSELLTRPSNAT